MKILFQNNFVKLLKKQSVQSCLWILAGIAIWETASRSGAVSNYILPPFSDVFIRLIEEIIHGKLGVQIGNSLLLVAEGFVVSILISIIVTSLCIASRIWESLFSSLCIMFNPLPGMALLPLIMMWFGINNGAMLALIVHGVAWPLVTNLLSGYKSVPGIYKEWSENIELTSIQKTKDIYLYAIMPQFISGLRIGWGRAWRALISAEMIFGMIGSLGGVGYYIYTNRAYANVVNVMVGILAIIIVGILMDKGIFDMLEKVTIRKWGMVNGK